MIELHGVWKSYDRKVVLRGLSLTVQAGDALVVSGPSGAGKTTLIRLLLALDCPDRGSLSIAGRKLDRLRRNSIPYVRRNIGAVFQDFHLLAERTALDNAAMSLEVLGLLGRERTTRSLEALALVGIEHLAKQRVAELCCGEQQRVAIARALASQPAILLCDEPTGSVDPACAENLLHLFDRLNREQTTLVIATHSPEVVRFARAAGWRTAELRQGELLEASAASLVPLLPLGTPFRAARLDEETEGFSDRSDADATDLIRLPGRGRTG